MLGDITAGEGSGISAYEDVIISGTVGDITCIGGIDSGIKSDFGSVIVEKTGSVGNITSEYDGIAASGDVIIAGKAGNILGGGYAGIHITGGDVTVSGNVESIIGYSGGIEVYQDFGWNVDGSEVLAGGNVAISGTVGKISGGMTGIRADADLNISGSAEVTATDSEIVNKCALSVGGSIVLSTDDIITEPAEYKITSVLAETYKDESGTIEVWHNTISDSEGTPALIVKFKGFVNPFEDVNASDWYYDDVRYAVVNSLFNGISETTFAPNNNLTRAMLVTVLYRAEGEPPAGDGVSDAPSFADVDMGAYYANAVSWAKQNNIVNGVTETEFAPNNNITREQIAAIIYRYAVYKGMEAVTMEENLHFADSGELSEYAVSAMNWAVGSGLIKGKTDTTLNPLDSATRAEVAAILHRFIESNK